MIRILLASLIAVASLTSCATRAQAPDIPLPSNVYYGTLPHPQKATAKVEYFWARPKAEGRYPVVIFIHGFQNGEKTIGGKDMVEYGVLAQKTAKGFVAVSVSQPGFGGSDGPRDYCGPYTQDAVQAVIREIRKWKFVDPDKVALYGVSRGAMVASMVTTKDPRIAAAVLVSGSFDLEKLDRMLRERGKSDPIVASIAENIKIETGGSTQAFRDRSALYHAKSIRTPTLIINGAKDDRADMDVSTEFSKRLSENGVYSKLVIFTEYGHAVPVNERNKEIDPFLDRYLLDR